MPSEIRQRPVGAMGEKYHQPLFAKPPVGCVAAGGVAVVEAGRSVAKPPVSLQVGFYRAGTEREQICGAFSKATSAFVHVF